jgi:hypothetical protein
MKIKNIKIKLKRVKVFRNFVVGFKHKIVSLILLIRGEKTLDFIIDVISNHNTNYVITYGTLLGFVRDGRIIRYDYDLDVGLLFEDYPKLIHSVRNLSNFLKPSCKIINSDFITDGVISLKYYGVKIDLGIYLYNDVDNAFKPLGNHFGNNIFGS